MSLSANSYESIKHAFPGKIAPGSPNNSSMKDDSHDTINLARLYDLKYSQKMANIFNQVNVENAGDVDEDMDVLGYLGRSKHQRVKIELHPISEM